MILCRQCQARNQTEGYWVLVHTPSKAEATAGAVITWAVIRTGLLWNGVKRQRYAFRTKKEAFKALRSARVGFANSPIGKEMKVHHVTYKPRARLRNGPRAL